MVREQFDWTAIAPASAIVETMARALDRCQTSFRPRYDHSDPDALNAAVRSAGPTDTPGVVVISFGFGAHSVSVHGRGEVIVQTNASKEGRLGSSAGVGPVRMAVFRLW